MEAGLDHDSRAARTAALTRGETDEAPPELPKIGVFDIDSDFHRLISGVFMYHGSCLCGDVTVTFATIVKPPVACHCSQCRKTSGHVWASVPVARDALTVTGPVAWFDSSAEARRGFCPRCGSSLLWEHSADDHVGVAAGCLDGPTGLTLRGHIFTGDKGDYYPIADGLPQS